MTGAPTRGAGGLLLALAFVLSLPLDGASDYSVSGVVVDSRSHAPLANTRVSLLPSPARDRKLEQVTKKDGRFSFTVNGPGKYSLTIAKPGYPPQAYKQADLGGVSSAIVVREDQDTGHIVFEARHGNAITGLVRDDDSEPVGNAIVAIFQSAVVGGASKIFSRGQTRANTAGEFRFSGLLSGNYYVCAMGRPWFADQLIQLQEIQRIEGGLPGAVRTEPGGERREGTNQSAPKFSPDPGFHGTAFPTRCYPNAQSVEQASLIRLDAGGEAQASIILSPTRAVSVKGTVSVPDETSVGHAVLYKKVHDGYVSFLDGWIFQGGKFQFDNVPPGSYEIMATSQADTGASSWHVRDRVEVGVSDVEVTLTPQPLGSLSGRVLFEGEHPAPTADLFVSLRDEEGSLVRTEVSPDGSFSLRRLPAGRYEVTAGNTDYIAAYLTGPDGKRLPLTLTISSGETIHRDLTLTRAVSVIEGTAESTGVPLVGAFVLLMPKNASEQWAYRVDQTDSDGSYRLGTIPSGDYFLIALSDGNDVAYRDAKVAAILTKAAKPVHVDAGDHLEVKITY